MVSTLADPDESVNLDPTAADVPVGDKLSKLKQQAKDLIISLPPVLHSHDVSGFCRFLLPVILSLPHDDDSDVAALQQTHGSPANQEQI